MWQIATSINALKTIGIDMATAASSEARINVRLPLELKRTIEEAAAALGQSVSEFTIATVVRESRQVLDEARTTRLSNRDRDALIAALDEGSGPNAELKAAARRYKKRLR